MAADPERLPLRPHISGGDHRCSSEKEAAAKAAEEAATKAEGNSWIAMTSLLVLSIGLCLEAYRFMNKNAPNEQELPSYLFILDRYECTEVFDIACMALSILWIFVTLGRYCCCQRQENPGKVHFGNYLIYGLVFFALGGMCLAILETMMFFSYECATVAGRIYVLTKIFYIIAQVFFIFFSRYRSVFDPSLINGVLLFHTIVTNVILYLRTFLTSKMESDDRQDHNLTQSHKNIKCNCSGVITKAKQLQGEQELYVDPLICRVNDEDILHAYKNTNEYISPFCLEFALTASALLAELWLEQSHSTHTSNQNDDSAVVQSGVRRELIGSVTSASVIGLGILASYIFILILDGSLESEIKAVYIYRVIVSSLMILICFIGLVSLGGNTPIGGSLGLDEILVYVSLIGVYFMCMLRIVAALISRHREAKDAQGYAEIVVVDGFWWSFQASLQAAFITKALHREPKKKKLADTSSLAVVLIFCNFGRWLMTTAILDGMVKDNPLPEQIYEDDTWTVIQTIIKPLVVFYRIHCVFTLYRVFNAHRTLSVDH